MSVINLVPLLVSITAAVTFNSILQSQRVVVGGCLFLNCLENIKYLLTTAGLTYMTPGV